MGTGTGTYAVVGCTDCSALWVVEGEPETTECPRCGKRRQFRKLRRFVETEDRAEAREARASILANRQGEGEAFAELDSFAEMEGQLDAAGVDDDEYLSASGLDPDRVEAAGERAASGAGGSTSRRETVEAALDALAEPTAEAVVAYAGERGVSEDYAREALERLRRAGEVTERDGVYRRL
jgi:hypothetical protein